MKSPNFSPLPWFNHVSWLLGPLRWCVLATMTAIAVSVALSVQIGHQTALADAEIESVLNKIKSKRLEQRKSANQVSGAFRPAASAITEGRIPTNLERLEELRLPNLLSVKAAPLGTHLSEARLKGMTLKQVDYVWTKSARAVGQDISVGRVEVNLNMEASYPAVRAWLGELLFREPHMQLNAIQFQRIGRDSALVNGVMTLSIYYEDAK